MGTVRIMNGQRLNEEARKERERESGRSTKKEGETETDEGLKEAEVVGMQSNDGERLRWKKARLHYRHLQTFVYQRHQYSVLRVQCFTGRQHQVRAQLSYERMPIIGDRR